MSLRAVGGQDNPSGPPGGDGFGGGGVDARLRAVETSLSNLQTKMEIELKHLATKQDVESIRTWALKGALWGALAVATLVISVLKLFG